MCLPLPLLCALIVSSWPGLAQTVAPAPDKAHQTIAAAIAALGGDRFLHMQTRVASGRIYSFFHDNLSGLDLAHIYVEYLPENSSGLHIQERELLGKKQDYSFLFLPDQAWDITFRGARPVEDESWARYQRATYNDILYILRYRLHEPGLLMDYIGSEVYLSTHTEVVDITDSRNLTIRVYFDHNSHLPVHQTYTWMDPQTRERNDEVTEYDKWRDAGGVMWPFSIERERNGYKTYQFFADRVEVNQPMPKNIFELPPNVKRLKKMN